MGFLLSKFEGFWSSDKSKNATAESEPEKKVYSWDLRSETDEENLRFCNKEEEVLIKKPEEINGNPFNIFNLTSCRVFLLDNIATINIDNCSNCAIFIGPTHQSVFIRNSRECNLIVSCQQFRMRDCEKANVLLHCTSQPIIESSIKIKFACFRFFYDGLSDQMRKANLSPFLNYWHNVYDFSPSSDVQHPNHSFLSETKVDECLAFFDLRKLESVPEDVRDLHLSTSKSVVPKTCSPKSLDRELSVHSKDKQLLVVLPFQERTELLETLIISVKEAKFELLQSVETSAISQDELERLLTMSHSDLDSDAISGGDTDTTTAPNFTNKMKSKGKVVALMFSVKEEERDALKSWVGTHEILKQNSYISRGNAATTQFEKLKDYLQMQFH